MDIHITYETLFDLLRKERSLNELQTLDTDFWVHVLDYIKEKEGETNQSKPPSEVERIKLQISNVKRIIKEIYERRERKILNIALNVVRTDTSSFVDTQNMLPEEKALFKDTLTILKSYKKNILSNVFAGLKPDISNISSTKTQIYTSLESELVDEEPKSKPEIIKEVKIEEISKEEVLEEEKELVVDKNGKVSVKFLTTVPKFMGMNKDMFGPFNEGDSASLPEKIAKILLKKGKVECV